MTEGTARLRGGAVAEGMALLDEAMLPVKAGRIPPDMAGNLYCQMIAVCWELFDLRRAREWTAATERWCEHFDSAVMFSGICRMHRVQLRQVSGEWDVAADDARIVCTELVGMNTQVVAEGHYLLGELLRLRSDCRRGRGGVPPRTRAGSGPAAGSRASDRTDRRGRRRPRLVAHGAGHPPGRRVLPCTPSPRRGRPCRRCP